MLGGHSVRTPPAPPEEAPPEELAAPAVEEAPPDELGAPAPPDDLEAAVPPPQAIPSDNIVNDSASVSPLTSRVMFLFVISTLDS